MEVTEVYAIAAGGVLLCFLLFRIRRYMKSILMTVNLKTSQHLIYSQLIHRHRYLGPWSRANVLSQIFYIAINMFCIGFNAPSIHAASLRAADLALINLIPAFAGPHLSFLADILGLSLSTYRSVHRTAGIMSCFLVGFHVLTLIASKISFPLRQTENLWGLIGASSICLLFILSRPIVRRLSYEVFLRVHQLLAALLAYSIWQHLGLKTVWPKLYHFPQLYVYIFTWSFVSTFLLQLGAINCSNWPTKSAYSRAYISHIDDTVMIRLSLSRPLRVEPGQYISLWMPTVSFWSFLQSHPFTVISWSDEKQDSLDLLIEPRGGLTQRLLSNSKATRKARRKISPYLALFSGPHGTSASVNRYETVLMVASGFGIAGQIPYLKKLIYGYNTCTGRTRRVHLVWQLETIDIGIATESSLTAALDDDKLDDRNILRISVYIENGKSVFFPWGRRAKCFDGSANLRSIFEEEMSGKYITRRQGEKPGAMLVIVSAIDDTRDYLRDLVRNHLKENVQLIELEYQPITQRNTGALAVKATDREKRTAMNNEKAMV